MHITLTRLVSPYKDLYTDTTKNVRKGIYLHYKGTKAEVLGVAKHSETKEELVVYKHQDPVTKKTELWVRPKTMFLEQVEVDGETQPRFRFLMSK